VQQSSSRANSVRELYCCWLFSCITPTFVCSQLQQHLLLFDILFVLKVKLRNFFQFTIVNFDLISNIFLCRYASRTLRVKLLTWCTAVSLAALFGSGQAGVGLKFV